MRTDVQLRGGRRVLSCTADLRPNNTQKLALGKRPRIFDTASNGLAARSKTAAKHKRSKSSQRQKAGQLQFPGWRADLKLQSPSVLARCTRKTQIIRFGRTMLHLRIHPSQNPGPQVNTNKGQTSAQLNLFVRKNGNPMTYPQANALSTC